MRKKIAKTLFDIKELNIIEYILLHILAAVI